MPAWVVIRDAGNQSGAKIRKESAEAGTVGQTPVSRPWRPEEFWLIGPRSMAPDSTVPRFNGPALIRVPGGSKAGLAILSMGAKLIFVR